MNRISKMLYKQAPINFKIKFKNGNVSKYFEDHKILIFIRPVSPKQHPASYYLLPKNILIL